MQVECSNCGAAAVLKDKEISGHSRVQFRCAHCGQTSVVEVVPAAGGRSSSAPTAREPRAAAERGAGAAHPSTPAPIAAQGKRDAERKSNRRTPETGDGGATAAGTVVSRGGGLALPDNKRITLSVQSGPSKGLTHELTKARVVIGRAGVAAGGAGRVSDSDAGTGSRGADLELNDPEISRQHCALEVEREVVRLRDLHSTNGTWIAQERVDVVQLEHLSEFRVGSSLILVTIFPK